MALGKTDENDELNAERVRVIVHAANRLTELAEEARAAFVSGTGGRIAQLLTEQSEHVDRVTASLRARAVPARSEPRASRDRQVASQERSGPVARREALRAATASPDRTSLSPRHRETLDRLDRVVGAIRHHVIDNPAWSVLEKRLLQPAFECVQDHLATDQTLVRAREHRDQAAGEFERAQRALEVHQSRPAWERALSHVVMGPATSDPSTAFEVAREALSEAERALIAIEHDVRRVLEDEVTVVNKERKELLDDSRDRLTSMEQPLRLAVLERFAVEQALLARTVAWDFEQAPPNTSMTYASISVIGGFAYHEFRDDQGRRFLSDAAELIPEALGLARGDRILVKEGTSMGREVVVRQRADVWSAARIVEGQVVEIDRRGDVFRGIKVRHRYGSTKWVRPRAGDDLASDLSLPVLRNLRVGDEVRIAPGTSRAIGLASLSINVTPATSAGHGR